MSNHNSVSEPSIFAWGELLWDLFPDGKRLGGAPANVAYHLAALSGGASPVSPVAVITRVGDDDLGREAVAALGRAGVNTALVQIDAARPTGRVDVEVHDGEPRYQLIPDCAWEYIQASEPASRALVHASAFCYGTLSQRRGHDQLARALGQLPAGCRTVCDLNLRSGWAIDEELVRFSLGAATVVKLNDGEVRMIEAQLGVADATRWMLDTLGVHLVAITRGAHGSMLVTADGTSEHPGFAAEPGGDNIGAGDSFVAAMVCLLGHGRSLAEINRGANRYAAFVASHRGATPDVPADIIREVLSL